MPTYVMLAKFTDQGIRNAKESPKRAEAFKQMAKTFEVKTRNGSSVTAKRRVARTCSTEVAL